VQTLPKHGCWKAVIRSLELLFAAACKTVSLKAHDYFGRRNRFPHCSRSHMKRLQLLLALPLLTGLFGCATAPQQPEVKAVSKVELPRYLGRWYEIARYPNRFEKGFTQVTADYTLKENGKIEVLNQGMTAEGQKKAVGKARVVPDSNGAKLKVSFFGPFEADYWVIGLDEKGYQWAIVGEPSRKYLWILSRKKEMPEKLYQDLLKKVTDLGYDPAKLERTPQGR